jgi:ribosomal protein S18 acetylase RimI-like enzyme
VTGTPRRQGDASVVELDQLSVAPAARNRGVGTRLCEEVRAWAEERGADRVELSTWSFNAGAQSLFARLGFATDFIRMSHELAPRE